MRRPLTALMIALLATMLVGCGRRVSIEGEWRGQDTTLYISFYRGMGFHLVDSVKAQGGRFTRRGRMDDRLVYGISPTRGDRHPALFVPERGKRGGMVVRLWEGGGIVVEDSPSNDLLAVTLATTPNADTLTARHPKSPVTAFVITRFLTPTLPYDSLNSLRQRLTLPHRHPYVKELDETLEAMRNIHVGAFAPPLTGVDLNDSILIVFHATWCPDCEEEWPHILSFLASHPGVRLQALDIDSVHWDGPEATAYAVRGIPATFLVAGGRILGVGLPM